MCWDVRTHRPSVVRAWWRSRPSWFFSVQMIASIRWHSQAGNTFTVGVDSSSRCGRRSTCPGAHSHAADRVGPALRPRCVIGEAYRPVNGRESCGIDCRWAGGFTRCAGR
jgi:hypothetical protein